MSLSRCGEAGVTGLVGVANCATVAGALVASPVVVVCAVAVASEVAVVAPAVACVVLVAGLADMTFAAIGVCEVVFSANIAAGCLGVAAFTVVVATAVVKTTYAFHRGVLMVVSRLSW